MFQPKILFVCLGNICRSPCAHAVMEQLYPTWEIDSAGTGAWHIGHKADARMRATLHNNGIACEHLRARAIEPTDFTHFDWILAMDKSNLHNLKQLAPAHTTAQIFLFLTFHPDKEVQQKFDMQVPDPYYGDEDGFETVFSLVQTTCKAFGQFVSTHTKD